MNVVFSLLVDFIFFLKNSSSGTNSCNVSTENQSLLVHYAKKEIYIHIYTIATLIANVLTCTLANGRVAH